MWRNWTARRSKPSGCYWRWPGEQTCEGPLDGPGVFLPAPAARHQRLRRSRSVLGHRKNNLLRSEDELFYGYYLSAGVMTGEENGPAVPELARRATLSSCRHTTRSAPSPPR